MTALQALVTGMIAGSLSKDTSEGFLVAIDVEIGVDADGNYTNEVLVTGRNSGEKLRITVDSIEGGTP